MTEDASPPTHERTQGFEATTLGVILLIIAAQVAVGGTLALIINPGRPTPPWPLTAVLAACVVYCGWCWGRLSGPSPKR